MSTKEELAKWCRYMGGRLQCRRCGLMAGTTSSPRAHSSGAVRSSALSDSRPPWQAIAAKSFLEFVLPQHVNAYSIRRSSVISLLVMHLGLLVERLREVGYSKSTSKMPRDVVF